MKVIRLTALAAALPASVTFVPLAALARTPAAGPLASVGMMTAFPAMVQGLPTSSR